MKPPFIHYISALVLCLLLGAAVSAQAEEPSESDILVSENGIEAPATQSGTTTYPPEGGELTFNLRTGTITSCTKGVTSANLPSEIEEVSVTSIEARAFENCANLVSLTIPDSVTSIGDSAFAYCSGLVSVTIPGTVKSIGASVFSCCTKLTSATILNGVASIGNGMFAFCGSLESVAIPRSVTSIGSSAFWECASLKTVLYAGSEEQWEAITNNTSLKNADIQYNSKFGPITYSLTVIDSCAEATGAGDYEAGSTVALHAGTRPGYIFDGWTVTGQADSGEIAFGAALAEQDKIFFPEPETFIPLAKPIILG